MQFTLPWPPSVNNLTAVVRGRKITSKRGREYRQEVYAALYEQKCTRVDGRLRLWIVAHPPDRRRRDLDNLVKAVADGLVRAGLFDDDSQIDDLRIVRGPVQVGGQLDVTLEPITTDSVGVVPRETGDEHGARANV